MDSFHLWGWTSPLGLNRLNWCNRFSLACWQTNLSFLVQSGSLAYRPPFYDQFWWWSVPFIYYTIGGQWWVMATEPPKYTEPVNLLHTEVSYIIDTACHWTFSFNVTSFSYFLECQPPRLFPFSNSQFSIPCSVKPDVRHDKSDKTRYQSIFQHCLDAVLQYLVIFFENQR